jgi:asparagine synthase (glutamine-hydrolysing)
MKPTAGANASSSATEATERGAARRASAGALTLGQPRFRDADLARIADRDGAAAAWVAGFERFGAAVADRVDGSFAVGIRDRAGRTWLAVDRFAICPLCYRFESGRLEFAERADALGSPSDLDFQAIFEYLYFHVIPAPRTVFDGVRRLVAGHYALLENGKLTVARWWNPKFDETHRDTFERARESFRRTVREAVAAHADGAAVGCFLSGGTDSSTVAGMLGDVTGAPARTFSIGFDVEGYDEIEYARIAARHFRTDHHEYYVKPDDLVTAIPRIAASYDQPFGNSSVLPAYCCARMAREAGVTRLLAGDGGDELFGGNSRYAKQRVFELYQRIPPTLRKYAIETMLLGTALPRRVPLVRKAVSYVEQARTPMPDRMQAYNLLVRLSVERVLTPEFAAAIDREAPLREQREVYGASDAHSLINRMLAFDWKYTLADSDLPKVVGATALAGVDARFPLLDNRLVDFSLRIDPEWKLKGATLRWFFKEALRGFLPDAILAKKKHGFGLPFGVWVNSHRPLKDLALDSLSALRARRVVSSDFLDPLTRDYLPKAPGYYGEMVWILVMLEQWLSAHAARVASGRGALTR